MDDVKNDVKNKTYNKKASEQNARKPWNLYGAEGRTRTGT